MADLKRALRGAYPGATIEPDATLRAALADLGHTPVVYGWVGSESTGSTAGMQDTAGRFLLDTAGRTMLDTTGA